jgi:hypothetical protein
VWSTGSKICISLWCCCRRCQRRRRQWQRSTLMGRDNCVVPQSLWYYDTLSLRYMTSQQNIQSPPS